MMKLSCEFPVVVMLMPFCRYEVLGDITQRPAPKRPRTLSESDSDAGEEPVNSFSNVSIQMQSQDKGYIYSTFKKFGWPFIASVPRQCSYQELYAHILRYFQCVSFLHCVLNYLQALQ